MSSPREFCEHHGFELVPELQSNGRYLVSVIDRDRRLFPEGIRNGTMHVHGNSLEDWLKKGHRELMDMILEQVYD